MYVHDAGISIKILPAQPVPGPANHLSTIQPRKKGRDEFQPSNSSAVFPVANGSLCARRRRGSRLRGLCIIVRNLRLNNVLTSLSLL